MRGVVEEPFRSCFPEFRGGAPKPIRGGIHRDVPGFLTRVPRAGGGYGPGIFDIKGYTGHGREGKLSNYQIIKIINLSK